MADAGSALGNRQRVTYVLPLPPELGGWRNSLHPHSGHPLPPSTQTFAVPPRLDHRDAARLSRRGPLLIPVPPQSNATTSTDETASPSPQSYPGHPRHMLPVTSLALDLTTCSYDSDADVAPDPAPAPDVHQDTAGDFLDPALGDGGFASSRLHTPKRPRGLLYTAGRDALIASWQLDLPSTWQPDVKPKSAKGMYRPWRLTQPYWNLHPPQSVGLGGMPASASGSLLSRPTFRQGIQAHSEWVNDLLLVNGNQTVISASSDRAIKAWNPHDPSSNSTTYTLGSHDDYVKSLAAPAWQLGVGQTQTIFSGGLDRTVKMWDVNAAPSPRSSVGGSSRFGVDDASTCKPVLTLNEADDELPSSVYSLSTDGRGSLVAVGCSANEVSVYDVRSRVRVAKLVGHTGYVRSLLLSADGRHLLSASSDSTVRLWSIAEQRALHTFEHHSDSVWALYSQDVYERDSISSFYSADRVGDLCKVDWSDAPDIVSGECVLLARNRPAMFNRRGSHVLTPQSSTPSTNTHPQHGPSRQGIDRIVAADDAYVFTASDTSSSVLAWPDVPKHKDRLAKYPAIAARNLSGGNAGADTSATWATQAKAAMQANGSNTHDLSSAVELAGVPASSLVTMGDEQSLFDDRPADDGTSSLDARRRSGGGQTPGRLALLRDVADVAVPLFPEPCARISGGVGLIRSSMLNDRRHVLTMDTRGSVGVWDILLGVCLGFFERRALTQLALDEEAMVGTPFGPVHAQSASGMTQEAITNLLTHSPADLLELIRERIEGSDAAPCWCTADVRAGLLSVHLQSNKCFDAEMYIDDAEFVNKDDYKEDTRINMGRWVLQNLFKSFIAQEIRARSGARASGPYGGAHMVPPSITSKDVLAAEEPAAFGGRDKAPRALDAPMGASLAIPPSDGSKVSPPGTDRGEPTQWSPYRPPVQLDVEVQMKALKDAHTVSASQSAALQAKLDGEHARAQAEGANNSSGGGFMSRFKRKNKDKDKKAQADAAAQAQNASSSNEPEHLRLIREIVSRVALLSPPLPAGFGVTETPPNQAHPLLDLPPLPFPPGVMVLFGAMSAQAAQALPAYRETVARMEADVPLLELVASPWLLANLLTPPPSSDNNNNSLSTTPTTAAGIQNPAAYDAALQDATVLYRRDVVKISFTLTAWVPPGTEEHADTLAQKNELILPDLPASTTRLTATQMLRMKKVAGYVVEKLGSRKHEVLESTFSPNDKNLNHTQAASHAAEKKYWSALRLPKEDEVEVLCNDVMVPPNMTLAQARRFLYRQSGDLKLEYRRIKLDPIPTPALVPGTIAAAHAATSTAAPLTPADLSARHVPQGDYGSRPSMADSYAPASESDSEGSETDSEVALDAFRTTGSAPLNRLGYQ